MEKKYKERIAEMIEKIDDIRVLQMIYSFVLRLYR